MPPSFNFDSIITVSNQSNAKVDFATSVDLQKAPIVISYWLNCDAHRAKNTRRTKEGP